jgi:hypothetical protein
MRRVLIFIPLAFLLVAVAAAQQDKSKRPSPPATAECNFADGKKVVVDYSQPSMRGRKIFGELVPYGQIWRTGANEATALVSDVDLSVGGTAVPAGKYTLYTLPSPESWKLIISKKTGQWGIPYPGEQEDFTRIDMTAEKTSSPVEKFTITFDRTKPDACVMKLEWESTRAAVEISERK